MPASRASDVLRSKDSRRRTSPAVSPRFVVPRAAAFLICLMTLLPVSSIAEERVGSVVHHEGTVLALRAQGATTLITGAPVYADDRVFTNVGARARIVFVDGSALAIGPGSLVVITDYRRADDGPVDAAISLFIGIVRAVVSPAAEEGRFDVQTQMAVASSRSTRFIVAVDDPGNDAAIFVIAGHVAVTPTAPGLGTIALEEGLGVDIDRDTTDPSPVPWGEARTRRVMTLTDTPE